MEQINTFGNDQRLSSISNEQSIVTGSMPLVPAVHQLLSRIDSERHIFNVPILWEVHMPIEYDLLEQTVAFLLRYHDGLRSRFIELTTGWMGSIAEPDDCIPTAYIDLSMYDEDQQRTMIEQEAERWQKTLNFTTGPLLRVVLFFLGEQHPCRVLFIAHHFVCDGFSLDILQQDFFTVYHQIKQGKVPELPPKTTSLQYYAESLATYAQSQVLYNEVDYWDTQERRQVTPLPVDYPTGIGMPAVRAFLNYSLNEQETRSLQALARQKITLSDVLLAVLFQTYAHWTGHKIMLVEISHHGRQPPFEQVDLSRTIGWLVNPVPFLLCSEQTEDVFEVIRSVKEQLSLMPCYGLGFGVLRYLGNKEVQERLRSLPLPQLLLNYMGRLPTHIDSAQGVTRPAGETLRNVLSQQMVDPIHIAVFATLLGKNLHITWQYQENLYERSTMERLLHDFLHRLRQVSSLSGSIKDGMKRQ